VLVPGLLAACSQPGIVGPGTYQVASAVPGGVAYCVAAGDTLNNVAELAREHCAAQNGARAEMALLENSATCSRGVVGLAGAQGQLVQYRCVSS
jgi:hypothetical protein